MNFPNFDHLVKNTPRTDHAIKNFNDVQETRHAQLLAEEAPNSVGDLDNLTHIRLTSLNHIQHLTGICICMPCPDHIHLHVVSLIIAVQSGINLFHCSARGEEAVWSDSHGHDSRELAG